MPRKTKQAQSDVEAIRRRAFEIAQGPDAGTPEENWLRAEAELRRPGADEDAVRRDEEDAIADAERAELMEARISGLTHP